MVYPVFVVCCFVTRSVEQRTNCCHDTKRRCCRAKFESKKHNKGEEEEEIDSPRSTKEGTSLLPCWAGQGGCFPLPKLSV